MNALNEEMTGRVAIVTGATSGIGKEVALGLARLGATLIVGARDQRKADETVAEIRRSAKHPDSVTAMTVDVSNLASVRRFAAEVGAKYPAVHILVNNAGAWFTDRGETAEGHELTFATNALGPYLLTKLLAERLKAAKGARVVNVVSSAAGNYDADDLEWKRRPFNSLKAYAQAKQALRMITWTQAAQLEKHQVTVNAVSPGFVQTDFNKNVRGFLPGLFRFLGRFIAIPAVDGADTVLWAAVSDEARGRSAKHFEKRKETDGKFKDEAALTTLAERCEAMTRA